jgi:DUF971 family protein
MNESYYPVKLSRDPQARCLVIEWNHGQVQRISYRALRDGCACAGCRSRDMVGESSGKPQPDNPFRILTAAETLPLDIVAMSPVGNYAYHIEFSDGHNTGIFTFDRLRSLGRESTTGNARPE